MKYEIHITRRAEADIIEAADHIEFILFNPKAADDLLDEAEKKLTSLSQFPEKYPLVDDPVLHSWGIRFTVVRGYLAFFIISQEDHRVHIARFLHHRRDWVSILKTAINITV